MNKSSFYDLKKSWRKPGDLSGYLRKLFIIFLFFTFAVAIGTLVLRDSFTKKLHNLSLQVKDPAQPQEITNILLELSSAENDFQKASLYGSTENLNSYKIKLNSILAQIELILKKYKTDGSHYFPAGKASLNKSFDLKLQISQEVFVLKRNVDSLLTITTIQGINTKTVSHQPIKFQVKHHIRESLSQPDTTVREVKIAGSKKSFFKRIRDAISNNHDSTATVKMFTVNREKHFRDSISQSMMRKQNVSNNDLIQRLNKESNLLTASTRQLVSANLNLVTQLHELIQELKDIHIFAWEKKRNETLAEYESASSELNSFTGLAILMVLVFIVLLLIYIRKVGKAEDQYLIENERAVMLAEQKSEMLAIMSHEIRNPLTTITGMIYILNKTMLSPDQQRRLTTISHASSMLMDTVNNILDVSKINYQKEEGLKLVSFKPCEEIRETVSVMSYIAENKQIYLKTEFSCAEDVSVVGDVFRLKQIMVNLLSNALKYTEIGGITVKVNILLLEDDNRELQVHVIDTGAGIPLDKQAKLFTRYYQVGSSQDKQGTGLGLYICQQLVLLQSGSIGIDSDVGKGSNFHFRIPYKLAEKNKG